MLGVGVPVDFGAAINYYKKAVEKNHLESMYNLALMYAYGRGTTQDFSRARALLDKAQYFNHAPSIYYIGMSNRLWKLIV